MQSIRALDQLDDALAGLRSGGRSLALVPTMGALHAGHIRLVEKAGRHADRVVATIFVNPTQFNDPRDLERYPRTEAEDLERLEAAGCNLAWLPTAEQIYPPGFATRVSVGQVGDRWEGEARPGHFEGVATVVARLFTAVKPNIALFGEKDFQQLAVIRRMTADLGLGVEIIGVTTVRDDDGLALSSRNALLSDDERRRAVALPDALSEARQAILSGTAVDSALAVAKDRLASAGFDPIDYVALVDAASLEPLDEPFGAMRLIAAATMGSTRLIDNLAVEAR